MLLKNVLSILKENNVRLGLEGDQLKIRAAKGAMTPEIKQLLVDNKAELLTWIKAKNAESDAAAPIARRDTNAELVLSFAQQRLWFIDQLDPNNVAYNIPAAARIKGQLDIRLLKRVFDEIIQRHEILRTTYHNDNGIARQVIHKDMPCPLIFTDVNSPSNNLDETITQLAKDEATKPFDLTQGPLIRVGIVHLNPHKTEDEATDYLLLLNLHHIITDGWSNGVLLNEVSTLYEAFSRNQASPLPDLPIQYADYASWQQRDLPKDVLKKKIAFWTENLQDVAVLELPMDHPRPAERSGQGNTQNFLVDKEITAGLNMLAKAESVTLFITLMAAFKTLLYRYSGQQDICVGTPTANRSRAELAPLIGFFVNTLALRTDLSANPSFKTLMAQVNANMIEANKYQDVPFESIVEALDVSRDMSVTPIFQAMLVLQNTPIEQSVSVADLSFSPIDTDSKSSKVDITFNASEIEAPAGNILKISAEYDTDIFDKATITRIIGHFQVLLKSIIAAPQDTISILPLMQAKEFQQVTTDWNSTSRDYPGTTSIAKLFEEQVANVGSSIALEFGADQLSYTELNSRANRLAGFLRDKGVLIGDRIAISLDRSVEMVIALIAIIKSGAAYVPLDPEYPEDRLVYMLHDTAAKFIITHSSYQTNLQKLPLQQLPELILLDKQRADIDQLPDQWNSAAINQKGEQLAYIMYTSGSTGQPKGVMIPQRGITSLVRNTNYVTITPDDVVAHASNVSFDAATFEIWGALLNGARLVNIAKDELLSPADLVKRLQNSDINILFITTALFNLYAAHSKSAFSKLKYLMFGGEACDPSKIKEVLHNGKPQHLLHVYGPTENTTFTTWHEVTEVTDNALTVPIGIPLSNNTTYILDNHGKPTPIGVAGEICCGGEGLALGYLNHDDLTQAAFVPDPFRDGYLMYRTGDIGRFLVDGSVEISGRVDDQVKIRGFRIELGEVETAVSQLQGVRECAIIVREDQPGNKIIAAYIIPEAKVLGALDDAEISRSLREELRTLLPDYMMPSALVIMTKLPLTANGKLDRRALPLPDVSQTMTTEYVATRNEQEEKIAAIWSQILGVERIGIYDNFFELGGHSLLATQAIARLSEAFGLNLPLRSLFEASTIETFAQEVARLRSIGGNTLAPPIGTKLRQELQDQNRLPLSFAQQRLWVIDQIQPGSSMYNIPLALHINGDLQVEVLGQVFKEIVRRHESLRTSFGLDGLEPFQTIHDGKVWSMDTIDLGSSVNNSSSVIRQHITEYMMTPFDLATGPLFKVQLIKLQNSPTAETPQYVLLILIHHIISDGASMEVLVREIAQLYGTFSLGQASALPELGVQYADYSLWQRDWLAGDVLQQQLDYWRTQLNAVPLLELPMDRPRPPQMSAEGRPHEFEINADLSQRLRELGTAQGTTLYMTLLAAFQLLLARYSGQDDIIVGSPIANRTQQAVEPLIGFFVNMLAMRSQIDLDVSFSDLLKQVKQTTLDAYQHQDVSFDQLVEELNIPRNISHSPLIQAIFTLQSTQQGSLEVNSFELGDITIEPFEDKQQGGNKPETPVKFDLSLTIADVTGSLNGIIEYRTELFDHETIEQLIKHFKDLLKAVIDQPNIAVGELPMLDTLEQERLLAHCDKNYREYPEDVALTSIFEQAVLQNSDNRAVAYGDRQLSFFELDQQSNQLAHWLADQGARPGDIIGLHLHRSVYPILAIWGIWKAGCAYTPLDPSYPSNRLDYMVKNSQLSLIVTEQSLLENTQDWQVSCCVIDSADSLAGQATTAPNLQNRGSDLAYIIYTSGSTGQPKGVKIAHQSVINLALSIHEDIIADLSCDAPLAVSLNASLSFDASVQQLVQILFGNTLYPVPQEARLDPQQLFEFLTKNNIQVFDCTPSQLAMLIDHCDKQKLQKLPKRILVGGEAISENLWRELVACRQYGVVTFNVYGPTECTVDCCWTEITAQGAPHIGKPIANTQAFIVDSQMQLMPVGVTGELYISGRGLALGYLNQPELTAERFINHQFSDGKHRRLYRTGDLARYRRDGNIDYRGRNDGQVKLRGLRIELGEIEAVLHQHEEVKETIVEIRDLSKGVGDSNNVIVAYLVPLDSKEKPDNEELRLHLRKHIPDYMIPSVFISLDEMPLTPNGKVNRKALPEPEQADLTLTEYVLPRNDTEKQLVKLWTEVLQIDTIGVEHNFFELGGHSLLAVKLITLIRQHYDVEIPVSAVFEASTIAGMANYIETVLWSRSEQDDDDSHDDGDREEFEL